MWYDCYLQGKHNIFPDAEKLLVVTPFRVSSYMSSTGLKCALADQTATKFQKYYFV